MIMLGVALFHVCFCLCMQCVGVLVYESCVIFFFLVLYVDVVFFFFFFFSSRRRHTRLVSDSSSVVCSSDLELPPNSQGVAALEMLKILEPFDLKGLGHNSAAYLHLLIETKKLAYADIARYTGDPAAMSVPTGSLLTDAYAASRRALIDPARAADRPAPGKPLTASQTIYLPVADSSCNIVSVINSLYDAFGSGVVVPGTGFALQDRGAGFTLEPGLPNTVAPGKRPVHTIIPAFVTR